MLWTHCSWLSQPSGGSTGSLHVLALVDIDNSRSLDGGDIEASSDLDGAVQGFLVLLQDARIIKTLPTTKNNKKM